MNLSKLAKEACLKNEEIWTQAYKLVQGKGNVKIKGYEVSNFGNVRSFWRIKNNNNNGFCSFISNNVQKVLKLKPNNHGYVRITLSGEKHCVHRIVMDSFNPIEHSEAPDCFSKEGWLEASGEAKICIGMLLEVNHINTNKSDNNFCNLERIIPKENSKKAVESYNGNHRNAKEFKKTKRFAVKKDGRIYQENNLQKFCCEHNLDRRAMQKLLKGECKSHKGFTRANDYYVNNKYQNRNLSFSF